MTVCHHSLPVAKAFCFLEDLRWEFSACFSGSVVALADRPYPFLEFGEPAEEYCPFDVRVLLSKLELKCKQCSKSDI